MAKFKKWAHSPGQITCSVLLVTLAGAASGQDTGNVGDDRLDSLFWSSIQGSDHVELYEAYLYDFPEGQYAAEAQAKIRSLKGLPEAPTVDSSSIKDCADCPELVQISPQVFIMGSTNSDDSAEPPHKVSINYSFSIGKYEITRGEWNFCVADGACKENPKNTDDTDPDYENRPAVNISWQDAVAYTQWLSGLTGKEYRLPSEAEWEYSARAGAATAYWWGDSLQAGIADCRDCGGDWNKKQPAVADAFPPNPLGLYNTAGGVSEWVQDCWSPNYSGAPVDGSARTETDCASYVLRGGSWKNKKEYLRSANRSSYDFNVRYTTNGFRVLRED